MNFGKISNRRKEKNLIYLLAVVLSLTAEFLSIVSDNFFFEPIKGKHKKLLQLLKEFLSGFAILEPILTFLKT